MCMHFTCLTCIPLPACVDCDKIQPCDGSTDGFCQVLHGSGPIAANLQAQFGIFLQNIYDTQVCSCLYIYFYLFIYFLNIFFKEKVKHTDGVLLRKKTAADIRIWTSSASVQSPVDTLTGYPISMHTGHTYTNTQDAFSSCLLAVWMIAFALCFFCLFECFEKKYYCQSKWLLLFCAFSIGSLNDCFCSVLFLLAVWMIAFVLCFFYWQSKWLFLFLSYLFIGSMNDCICFCAICLLAVWMVVLVPVVFAYW